MASIQGNRSGEPEQTRRAAWIERVGRPEVLQVVRRPVPRPRADEVLVKVHASSMNPRDTLMRAGRYPFQPLIRFPFIPGSDVAGTVEQRGRRVRSLALGQPVYGMQPSRRGFGAHAEYVAVPASALAPKPETMSFHHAAGLPLAGLTAYQGLTGCLDVQPGQRILIVGASGGVGTYAVQMARALGCDVTAVTSGRNVHWVEALGAHRVLDYQTVEVHDPQSLQGAPPYDAVFDAVGVHDLERCRPVLAPGGTYVTTIPRPRQMLSWAGSAVRHRLGVAKSKGRTTVVLVRSDGNDLRRFNGWVEQGRLRTVIERVLPLADLAEAHRHIQTARTRGKVILDLLSEGALKDASRANLEDDFAASEPSRGSD